MSRKKRIILVAVAFIAIGAALALYATMPTIQAMTAMTSLPTGRVTDEVLAVKTVFVNSFLYEADGTYLLFDAGMSESTMRSGLEKLGIAPEQVSAVFMTHTDGDHTGGLPLFGEATVYLASSNAEFLATEAGRGRSGAFLKMDLPYVSLDDEQTVEVAGTTVRCIFTPGHTEGSASFLVDGRLLFTGDTVRLDEGRAITFFEVYNDDTPLQEQSLHRLAALNGVEAMFTAHSGYTTDLAGAFAAWH